MALVARKACGAGAKATAASGEIAKRATRRFCIVIVFMVMDLIMINNN
jgi:hypothetical protein